MKLAQGIGANPNKFMGTKTNISFLGKGPTRNPLFQQPLDFLGPEGRGITAEALGDRGKLISAIEDAMGYATAGKLNPIQTEMLSGNLKGIYEILHPPVLPSASVTNIAPGIEGLRRFPKESHKFFGRPLKDKDFIEIERLAKEGKLGHQNPEMYGKAQPGSTMAQAIDESVNIKPGLKYFEGWEIPEKTASARATMIRLLDESATAKGTGLTLREAMSKQDLKWLLTGGGGTKGDPITLFAKYFGNASTKQLPSGGTPEVIEDFAMQVIRRKDLHGRRIDDPFFNREDLDFAGGGLAHILQVPRTGYSKGRAVKSLMGLVNKKFGKDTLKRASDLPKGTKYETLEAVKDFEKRTKTNYFGGSKADPFSPDFDMRAEMDLIARTPYTAAELKQLIIQKYKGRIDDKLLQQMLADDNPQRLAEVMATVDEALIMQGKGMGPESIIQSFKESWKRKPNASGGLARILEV